MPDVKGPWMAADDRIELFVGLIEIIDAPEQSPRADGCSQSMNGSAPTASCSSGIGGSIFSRMRCCAWRCPG